MTPRARAVEVIPAVQGDARYEVRVGRGAAEALVEVAGGHDRIAIVTVAAGPPQPGRAPGGGAAPAPRSGGRGASSCRTASAARRSPSSSARR